MLDCRYERRKSQQMMVSIEDEAAESAEVANLMARRNSQMQQRNGYDLERRMSRVSKRSQKSSGSGSGNGGGAAVVGMTTTTAEVS